MSCVVIAAHSAAAEDAPAPVALPVADVKRDARVSFEKEILPVFSANCLACHNRTKARADLVLETPADILKGGESGPAAVAGKGSESLLLRLSAHREEPVMPPKGNKVAAADLSPEQLGLLKLWIDQGAAASTEGAATPTVQWGALPSGLNAVYAVAVTPDGQYAACSRGSEIHVYHLPTSKLVSRLAGHRDLVQSLAFAPDGNLLASGAYREVKLWRRPRDVKAFAATTTAGMNSLDVSPDGTTCVTGGADGVVRLWGATDGRPVKDLAGHGGPITAVRFSPDGARIASASADKTVRVWEAASGAVFAQTCLAAEPAAVAWLSGGKQLAVAGADAVVRVWEMPTSAGAPFGALTELTGHDGPVVALCALPGAPTHLLSGGADGTVRRWDAAMGQVIRHASHGAPVTAVAARPDGKRFASAGGNVVKLWDAEGKAVAELKGDRYANEAAADRQRDLAFAGSEIAYHQGASDAAGKRQAEQVERVKKAAAADAEADKGLAEKQKAKADAEAKKTAADAKKVEAEIKAAEAEVKKAGEELKKAETAKGAAADELRLAIKSAQGAFDAAAQALAALEVAGREKSRIETELAALKATATAAEKPARTLTFSADGLLLAAGGDDGVVRTFGAETGTPYETFRGAGATVAGVAFAGDRVVSAGVDGVVTGWTQNPPWSLASQLGSDNASSPFADRVTALDFSDDGKWLATGGGVASREGEAILWEMSRGSIVRKFEQLHSDAILALDLSSDGRLLATAGADRWLKVSDTATGALLKTFEGHAGHVLGVSFQRDGRTLATASADNSIKVWDYVGGGPKKAIPGGEKEVTSVRFVGDTGEFVAASGDGRVRLLRPDGGEVRTFAGAAGFVYATAVSRDGSVVVAGGEDGTLRAWNATSGQPLATLPPPTPKVGVAKATPPGVAERF